MATNNPVYRALLPPAAAIIGCTRESTVPCGASHIIQPNYLGCKATVLIRLRIEGSFLPAT